MKIQMMMLRACLAGAVMIATNAVFAETADYVFKNGAIYTIDSQNPKAEAIAISGKHIVYVGNNDGAQAFIGDKTEVTDLQGRMLLPGFVEAHIHPGLAFFTKGADCNATPSRKCWQSQGRGGRKSGCQGDSGFWLALLFIFDYWPKQRNSDKLVSRSSGASCGD